MTKGVDDTTIDGFSDERVKNIIRQLKEGELGWVLEMGIFCHCYHEKEVGCHEQQDYSCACYP